MDSTSSNGGVRARSRKATTSPVQPPNGASVQRQTVPADGASDARPNANVTQRRPTQAVAESRPLPPETYAAIAIEAVEPELDGGRWPIKRVVGDSIEVSADIFKEGHDVLYARTIHRLVGPTDDA